MSWTKEQKNAIDIRGKNILVSAAAGSGKTAVLVERICSKVMDKENPVDIDKFLVVTFTKAAAGQMRDKISERLWAELEKNPDNEHLMRQTVLINRADISTIDGFCLKLVKEYFSLLDIDADFSVGDRGELALLKADVADALFEEKYETEDEAEADKFLRLVNIFSEKQDDDLKNLIMNIHDIAASYPKPEAWHEQAKSIYGIKTEDELLKCKWVQDFYEYGIKSVGEAVSLAKKGKRLCQMPGGPYVNTDLFEGDIEKLENIKKSENYKKLAEALTGLSWKNFNKKDCRGGEFDEELLERADKIRKQCKDIIKKLDIIKTPASEIISQQSEMGKYMLPLIELVEEFSNRYMAEKKKRHTMEFSDIAHLAYSLVCGGYKKYTDDFGNEVTAAIPTEIGEVIGSRYEEIYIDEYQDSNFLQEDILSSVSGISKGNYNLFMVGDVKQSIYRFRMARPDLFIDKYKRYQAYSPDCEAGEVKVELKNNFRSRAVVLNAANYFFFQLMGADMGGIDYTDEVALVPSMEFAEADEDINISTSAELMILNMADEELSDDGDSDKQEADRIELEAEMIVNRIEELTGGDKPLYIYDDNIKEYRKSEYRDIVILLKSLKGYGEILYNMLANHGIPAYIEEPNGYFEATEIRVVMSFLSVIDNSRQDIPLSAVLLSPIGHLDENEIALVSAYAAKHLEGKHMLYDKCIYYMENVEDNVSAKLKQFFDMLLGLKKAKITMSISELILKVYDETGYFIYASSMPAGDRRRSNLNALVDRARKFENGAYKGLFNFLRYVEKLKLNEVDFSEAGMPGEKDNVVKIITMHKSKGLEFPVCFVSGLGKQFNIKPYSQRTQVSTDYFIMSKLYNAEKRYMKDTVMRDAGILLSKQESYAEEIRVLYVAMTRAKEKLILTGYIKDYEDTVSKMQEEPYDKMLLPYNTRNTHKGFLYWILNAMKRYEYHFEHKLTEAVINTRLISAGDINIKSANDITKNVMDMESFIGNAVLNGKNDAYEKYGKSFSYTYPYELITKIKSKMSISEIKKMKAYDGVSYEVSEETLAEGKAEKNEMKSKKDAKGLSGADRGTIIHKFMELIDFSRLCDLPADAYDNYVKEFKEKLVADNVFLKEETDVINPYKICAMLKSDLGQRMIAAAKAGGLKKEQQFSIGIPVKEIYENVDSDDIVIVQGIIDAFFYEGDEIILMDYKTDNADVSELIARYHAQLKYYGATLEKLTGKKVKEKLIYSFHSDMIVEVKGEEYVENR